MFFLLGTNNSILYSFTHFQGLLDAHSVRVLVVSFGCREGGQLWLEQTGCKYNMLLDPERNVYKAFGLGSSYTKVMSFRSLLKYAEYIVLGQEFPDIPPRFLEDLYQLGGDFVLDEEGKVIFSHPCRNPLDRPKVEHIVATILSRGHPSTL
uniref:Selenoprotein L n=1 Tax=Esox lucius TaxID=8010 RepID=A0AAY5KNJ6_ESOLU